MALILLVDDDADFSKMVRLQLERLGHEVIQVYNGREAAREWQKQPFDLMLTDLVMPEREGLETIQEMSRVNPGIRIVAMSAGVKGAAGNLLQVAKYLGARETLEKPFSQQELAAAVDAALLERPASS